LRAGGPGREEKPEKGTTGFAMASKKRSADRKRDKGKTKLGEGKGAERLVSNKNRRPARF